MITTVLSKKGGVGKTTTTVNLAAALALGGERVLVVDLDSNAGASLSMGLVRSDFGPGTGDVLLRDVPATEAVRPTAIPDLFVLPASVDLRSAEIDLDSCFHKSHVLEEKLAAVRSDYDHIFVDCPSSVGLLTRNAVVAADAFLVPATPHFLALEGLEHLVSGAERTSYGAGRTVHFLGVVLTAVDYRIRTTRTIVERIRRRFANKTFAVEIRTNICLAEAPAFGQTVFQYRPNSTGAKSYALLAEEFQLLQTRLDYDLRAAV